MSAADERTAERIAQRGRDELIARLHAALARQADASTVVTLDADERTELVIAAVGRAGGALWRRCLAEAATAELGIELPQAVSHPAVLRAHELVAAPAYEIPAEDPTAAAPTPAAPAAPDAVRLPAVHLDGIAAIRRGEDDLELRFSAAGLDLLTRSTGTAIGRLPAREIVAIELPPARRGRRPGRRRDPELHVRAGRGRASFAVPGLTEEQIRERLAPVLERAAGWRPTDA